MRWLLVLAFLAGCTEENPGNLGLVGKFKTTTAKLEVNNCLNSPPTITPNQFLIINETDPLRKLGVHYVAFSGYGDSEGCARTMETILTTELDYYIGTWLFRITCSEYKRCLAAYMGDFAEVIDGE